MLQSIDAYRDSRVCSMCIAFFTSSSSFSRLIARPAIFPYQTLSSNMTEQLNKDI